MALNRAAQEKALKTLKYSDEDIAKILDDTNEVDITIPDTVKVYTTSELTDLENNIRKGYIKEGVAAEIWCRQMNKEHELGLTGADAKDQYKVLEAMKAKWAKESNATPSEWEQKFKELQGDFTKKDGEILTIKQQLEAAQQEKLYRKLFFADMSDALDDDEWIARLQRTFEIKQDGDTIGLVDRSTGKFIIDDIKNTLPFQAAFEHVRKAQPERFKSWLKPEPPKQDPADQKQTHDPRKGKNPILNRVPKYKTDAEIIAEVNKKFPPEKRGEKNYEVNRRAYFQELKAMNAA